MLPALVGALAASLLAFALACGSDEEDPTPAPRAQTTAPTQAPATAPQTQTQPTQPPAPSAQFTGQIAIAGSSTVFPISEAVAEEFSIANPDVRVNVASTGTGAGGRAMCAGEIQVWNASRPAKDSELETCAENGIEVVELPVAFDALSVVVSPENDWAQCLTVDELETIFGPDAQGNVTNWSQVRSDFPDQGLRIYGPTTASGTFDYFTEAIMGESGAHRGDLDLATEEDPLIASGVNGARGGIGYFGLAYLEQYRELVQSVEVVNPGTGECVEPSSASVANGQYIPLARPIFIYARLDQMLERPEVQAFVDFYLDEAGTLSGEVGYVALPESAYQWGRDRIASRTTGSVFNTIAAGTPLDAALAATSGDTSMSAKQPPANLTGEIAIAGSSTVFPISEAVAEEFSIANPDVRVNVASTGTGAGGRAMCAGEIQVWNASRPAKDSELETCAENGIEVVELPVAFDALSVVVSPENDWAQCLTVDELETIFGPDAQGNVTNWSQVRSDFPDQGLRIYGPTTASGTFDYFTEAIMGESGAHRGDLDLATEEDPLIASGVNGARGGIGYFGLAYLEQYRELVQAVEVVNPGTGECVEPSSASVANGQYIPLARPIFIYARLDHVVERPEVAAFVDFYLKEATTLVGEVGYVALPESAYEWGKNRVANRSTGSVFNTIAAGTPLDEALEKVN